MQRNKPAQHQSASGKVHLSVAELATRLQAEPRGNGDHIITGLATLASATAEQLAFYANHRYRKALQSTTAGCVLLSPKDSDLCQVNCLVIDDPYLAFAKLTQLFAPKPSQSGIHPSAVIGSDSRLGKRVSIGPHVLVGDGATVGDDVVIGANTTIAAGVHIGNCTQIYPNTSIYAHTKLGQQCIIHSGCVIGGDGFGFASSITGWQKIYQLGSVQIGNHVEIGAGTTIDRGALDDTRIGNGVKIDNQVQIGHNVCIGDHTAIAAAVAIAGSVAIGQRCTIAGGVGIVGHIHIADDVHITAMTMVTKSIHSPGSFSSGTPMNTTSQWRKNAARFNQLNRLAKQVQQIKNKVL